jgi:dGTPase
MIQSEFEPGYEAFDRERFVEQPLSKTQGRGEFARDRARVLHSSSFRKLSAKTQVLSPSSKAFARTRLTHSLEVAQVGRELAVALGVNPDLVDTACLAHDIGHPPFGHNGESALNLWAADIGGFEGNAQTFRILTRLETKILDENSISRGLNLTRAALDASTKYPWQLKDAAKFGNQVKFGVYEDDQEVFEWMRLSAPEGVKCIEAQIMDLADDVAYSIHDFEDAIVEGLIDPKLLNDPAAEPSLIEEIGKWEGGNLTQSQLEQALSNLRSNENWLLSFDQTPKDLAKLKNLTSDLIGSFVMRTIQAVRASSAQPNIARYKASLIVPSEVRSEIAVLKGLVASQVMTTDERQPYYESQRELLIELANALLNGSGKHLDPVAKAAWDAAKDEAQKRRAVVDAVASLTDPAAIALHAELRA